MYINASTRPVNKKEVKAKVEKLYADGKVAYMKKVKQKEKDNIENQSEENILLCLKFIL